MRKGPAFLRSLRTLVAVFLRSVLAGVAAALRPLLRRSHLAWTGLHRGGVLVFLRDVLGPGRSGHGRVLLGRRPGPLRWFQPAAVAAESSYASINSSRSPRGIWGRGVGRRLGSDARPDGRNLADEITRRSDGRIAKVSLGYSRSFSSGLPGMTCSSTRSGRRLKGVGRVHPRRVTSVALRAGARRGRRVVVRG